MIFIVLSKASSSHCSGVARRGWGWGEARGAIAPLIPSEFANLFRIFFMTSHLSALTSLEKIDIAVKLDFLLHFRKGMWSSCCLEAQRS